MTNFANRLMVAAATLVVAAGVASAETLKADIPFAFRVGGATMSPGTYQVKVANSGTATSVLSLYSADTRQSAIAVPIATHDVSSAVANANRPVIAFECAGNRCSLQYVWDGKDRRSAYRFATPKPGDEPSRIAVIEMHSAKGD